MAFWGLELLALPLWALLLSSRWHVGAMKIEERKGPLFYIHELPEWFWWRWPKPGTDCSENGYVGHDHAENSV